MSDNKILGQRHLCCGYDAEMRPFEQGEWVAYADYARLKAEVERLRKAGDAMADEIIGCYLGEGYDPADSETLPKWNAAKEGKNT